MSGKNRAIIESDNLQAGYDLGRAPEELREMGVEAEDIEVIPEHRARDKIAEARFMEERVLVEIEQDDDPNSAVFVYTGHNGIAQYIERGKPQMIRRKYLYSALAAKTIKMACSFGLEKGGEYNRLTPNARTTFRVRLLRDDNPQGGMAWFQKVMQGAA